MSGVGGFTPSSILAFHEALTGPRGNLDSWLECNNEAEVRGHIIAYAENAVAEVLALANKWRAENGDYPESKRDCADELIAAIRKATGSAEE